MSITAEELLASAGEALTRPTEADRRVSTHQAYYAFFHRALVLAAVLQANISGGSQHSQLFHFMKGRKDQRFAIIGKALESALSLRVKADYELDVELEEEEVEEHFKRCQRGLEQVEQLLVRFSEQPQP
jgi:hypothetical protein